MSLDRAAQPALGAHLEDLALLVQQQDRGGVGAEHVGDVQQQLVQQLLEHANALFDANTAAINANKAKLAAAVVASTPAA